MDKEVEKMLSCIGIGVLAVVLFVICEIIDGFTASVLWNWFAVSLFGAPHLTIGQALGASLVVSAFVGSHSIKHDKDRTDMEKITDAATLLFLRLPHCCSWVGSSGR